MRESLLFLRLGSFALDVADIPPHIQYPTALIQGSGKQEPLILDTTGLPSLIRDVPPVAVWQPVQALTIPTTTTDAQFLTDPVETDRRRRVSELTAAGWSATRIAIEVVGNDSGRAVRWVKQVQAELQAQQQV